MFRIKLCLLLIALLLLPTAFASGNYLSPDDVVATEEESYQTALVENGTVSSSFSIPASAYYPHTYDLTVGVSGAKFVKYFVSNGQTVKKGANLMSFTVTVDTVEIATQKLTLTRAEESFAEGKTERESAIESAKTVLTGLTDPYEKEIQRLTVEKMTVAYEQYLYQQERSLSALRARVESAHENNETLYLKAPADGVISGLQIKRAGESIGASEVLLSMYSTDDMLIAVSNQTRSFRYNMEVSVELGKAKSRASVKGRVVAADDIVPEGKRTDMAYILLDSESAAKLSDLRSPTVCGSSITMNDVLFVPRKALTLESGKYYLTKLMDGIPRKRYVNCFSLGANLTTMLILQGAEAGETVILN